MKRLAPLAFLAAVALMLAWNAPSALAGYVGKPAIHKTDSGTIVTDPEGTPLYTYEYDKTGKSNCFNTCNNVWIPERASDSATPSGPFGIISRRDGIRQWTYDGMPLYGFTYDMKGGPPLGNRIAGFHLATAG